MSCQAQLKLLERSAMTNLSKMRGAWLWPCLQLLHHQNLWAIPAVRKDGVDHEGVDPGLVARVGQAFSKNVRAPVVEAVECTQGGKKVPNVTGR